VTQGMGWALEVLNAGGSVARQGWNGKGLSLVLVRAGEWAHTQSGVRAARFVALRAGGVLVPWTCSQTDLLAEDWVRVD
jgi:hypothetical protein